MNEDKISEIVANAVSKFGGGKMCITLDKAKKLADIIEKKAREIGVNAVVEISDTGANPILIECMDNAFIASYDIALNKSYTAVALKMSTARLKTISQPGDELYGIQFTNNGRIVIFGGGDPLEYNGNIIGGLGVSGGSESEDTYLSAYGASQIAEIMKGDM